MYDNIICSDALSRGYGLLKDLERELSESEVRNLELLGYIENAIASEGETWKLTHKGKKLRNLLAKDKTIVDIVKDWIYTRLLSFNVNL